MTNAPSSPPLAAPSSSSSSSSSSSTSFAPKPTTMTSSTSPLPGVSISALNGIILFIFGTAVFTLVIQLLQNQGRLSAGGSAAHNVAQDEEHKLSGISGSQMILSVVCGFSAVLMAVMFPYADCIIQGAPKKMEHGWADIARCLTIFLGIIWASSKLPLLEGGQLSIILSMIAVGEWWLFDRTGHGFVIALMVAFLGSIATQIVVYSGSYRFLRPDFFEIQSWTPVVLFAAAICFGTIGRQMNLCFVKSRPSPSAKLQKQ